MGKTVLTSAIWLKRSCGWLVWFTLVSCSRSCPSPSLTIACRTWHPSYKMRVSVSWQDAFGLRCLLSEFVGGMHVIHSKDSFEYRACRVQTLPRQRHALGAAQAAREASRGIGSLSFSDLLQITALAGQAAKGQAIQEAAQAGATGKFFKRVPKWQV